MRGRSDPDDEPMSVSDTLTALVTRIHDPELVLDYYQCDVIDYPVDQWARVRGVTDHTVRGNIKHARRKLAISYLQEARDIIGRSPSANEFDELDPPISTSRIRSLFGSWNEAKAAAGLEIYPRGDTEDEANGDSVHPSQKRTSMEECKVAIRKAAMELGHVPSRDEYETLDISPSSATIRKRLAPNYRWAEVLAYTDFSDLGLWEGTSDLKDAGTQSGRVSDNECIEAVQKVAEKIGHVPARSEYDDAGIGPHSHTVCEHLAPNRRWAEVLARVDFEDVVI